MNDPRVHGAVEVIDDRIAIYEGVRDLAEEKLAELRRMRAAFLGYADVGAVAGPPPVSAPIEDAPLPVDAAPKPLEVEPSPVVSPPAAPPPCEPAPPPPAAQLAEPPPVLVVPEAEQRPEPPVRPDASRRDRLVAFVKQHCAGVGLKMSEIVAKTGLSRTTVYVEVNKLVAEKVVDLVGSPSRVVFRKPTRAAAAPAPKSAPQEPPEVPALAVPAVEARDRLRVPPAPPPPTAPSFSPVRPAPKSVLPVLDRRVIAIDGITCREDRFRCAPLSATMSAGACADRQKAANAKTDAKRVWSGAVGSTQHCAVCANCALGKRVLEQLKANVKRDEATA